MCACVLDKTPLFRHLAVDFNVRDSAQLPYTTASDTSWPVALSSLDGGPTGRGDVVHSTASLSSASAAPFSTTWISWFWLRS